MLPPAAWMLASVCVTMVWTKLRCPPLAVGVRYNATGVALSASARSASICVLRIKSRNSFLLALSLVIIAIVLALSLLIIAVVLALSLLIIAVVLALSL